MTKKYASCISANVFEWIRNIEERLDSDSKHEEIKELYEFGFANRGENPYAPTGSRTHIDCNTYDQYEDVVHQKLNNIARHDALMKQQQEDSRRMKALKKEYKQKRAKEHAKRKIARERHIEVIVEKNTSIFQRIWNYFRSSL